MTTRAELLGRTFSGGTRVVNCLVHSTRPITERPDHCPPCLTDLRNHLNYAISVNEWLNTWKDDAVALLRAKVSGV